MGDAGKAGFSKHTCVIRMAHWLTDPYDQPQSSTDHWYPAASLKAWIHLAQPGKNLSPQKRGKLTVEQGNPHTEDAHWFMFLAVNPLFLAMFDQRTQLHATEYHHPGYP